MIRKMATIASQSSAALTFDLVARCSVRAAISTGLMKYMDSNKLTEPNIDNQGQGFRPDASSWPGAAPAVYAGCYAGLAEGLDTRAVGGDGLPTLSE